MSKNKTKVLFDRFLPAVLLDERINIQTGQPYSDLRNDLTWNCPHELIDNTHMSVKPDGVDYERIFKLKLCDTLKQKPIDLEISYEVGLQYTGKRDPISFMVSDGSFAIGMQLRDLPEYGSKGPYLGIEGTPGRRVLDDPVLHGEGRRTASRGHYPRVFKIHIKPLQKVAFCHSAIDCGHLLTVNFDEHNPTVDITAGDLYLDVFRMGKEEVYMIDYIKATVTATLPGKAKP